MKAVLCRKYGPPEVLHIAEVPKPVPKDNEVLIRVRTTTVTAGDCEVRRFEIAVLFWLFLRLYLGISKPRIPLGQELAGEVEAIGKKVTRFKQGDQVFAATLIKLGAYAEYSCLPDSFPILTFPANMNEAEAATIPTGAMNSLHFLKTAKVKSGDEIVINGAGGSIGTYGLQIAKAWGAVVTCVDSADKLEMLRSLGADHVVDYRVEDFTRSGKKYDAIIDIAGKCAYAACLKSLKSNGRLMLGNPRVADMLKSIWTNRTGSKKVISRFADYKIEDLAYVKDLIEAGTVRSVIDRIYDMSDIVDAHRYVEAGLKKGNVVVRISNA